MMEKVNLAEKLSLFSEHWSPRIIGELNGQEVRIAKVQGEFIWHSHEDADELFLVIDGRLTIELRDREVVLEPGELFVVPRGVEHKPVAEEETSILMVETAGTKNTGEVTEERTIETLERI
jgi:mannose-6-phosphate isomerase-like protein (cupin superfamily)